MIKTFSLLFLLFIPNAHFAQDKCKVLRSKDDQLQLGASSGNDCCKDSALVADKELNKANKDSIIKIHAPFGVPKSTSKNVVVLYNPSYITGYDTVLRIPMWVQYKLQTENEMNKSVKRTDCFRFDTRIPVKFQASYNDYALEDLDTFQRGHLKPSADSYRSYNDNLNSFIMTNMAPQHQTLNTCEWEALEEFVRAHSVQKDIEEAYIISGSQASSKSTMLNGKVALAEGFYKIYFFKKGGKWYYWTFYLKHDSVLAKYEDFVSDLKSKQQSIDQLEKQNKVNFFVCEKKSEKTIEAKIDIYLDLFLLPKYNAAFCNKYLKK